MVSEIQRRIRENRIRHGMSQEELADKSGLSLRTIQRVENGETDPRGDTLKRIAAALELGAEELIDWKIEVDSNLLMIMNISQLAFLAFPLLGIIIPLILWILKKDKIKDVNRVGKAILNYQISWNLLLFLGYTIGLLVILITGHVPAWLFYTYVVGSGSLYLFNIIIILKNTFSYHRKEVVRYQPAIKFLK